MSTSEMENMEPKPQGVLRDPAVQEESRRLRRLQWTVRLVMETITQGNMPYGEASELITATRQIALRLFPGKEETFDLLYRPRLQRLLVQKYRLQ